MQQIERMPDEGKFSIAELARLKEDLVPNNAVEAANLLNIFLAGRGYGADQKAIQAALDRYFAEGMKLEVLDEELERIALES